MNFYDFNVLDINNNEVPLSNYKGKIVLVVNTASKCGLTPQYEGLEKMYKEFKDKDFVILGFPCNQFMGQEPGTNDDIKEFCSLTYDVTFPLFSKVNVNGKDQHPLFKWLKSHTKSFLKRNVKWNFTKFLIGRDGEFIERFEPATKPEDFHNKIKDLL
ncbi:MAG: glutathione peroxidase [Bacilli bacterium]